MNQTFSRAAPSARYKKLVALYNRIHIEGEPARNRPLEKVYPGDSLPVHALPIKVVIDTAGTRTLLDYGAGKGLQCQWQNLTLSDGRSEPGLKLFWRVDSIACFSWIAIVFRHSVLGPDFFLFPLFILIPPPSFTLSPSNLLAL